MKRPGPVGFSSTTPIVEYLDVTGFKVAKLVNVGNLEKEAVTEFLVRMENDIVEDFIQVEILKEMLKMLQKIFSKKPLMNSQESGFLTL